MQPTSVLAQVSGIAMSDAATYFNAECMEAELGYQQERDELPK